MSKKAKSIAVSEEQFQDFGCPQCGGTQGFYPKPGVNGSKIWYCANCQSLTAVLSKDVLVSSIPIGNYFPKLQAHPRAGKPADKKVTFFEDPAKYEFDRFKILLSLGFNDLITPEIVKYHNSKHVELPIVSAMVPRHPVKVAWFGQDFYSHYLGLQFSKKLSTSLMYPISATMGEPPFSSHINMSIAKPIPNFLRAYSNQETVRSLGMECGSGITASLIIMFMMEISKLNSDEILGICLNDEGCDRKAVIDSNYVDFGKLASVAKLKGKEISYDFILDLPEESIFESIIIDMYDLQIGGSSVIVKLKEGKLIPELPFPNKRIYVNPQDTILSKYLSEYDQPKEMPDIYDNYLISRIPVYLLKYREENYQRLKKYDRDIWFAHYCVNQDCREFILNTDNILDAVMTAIFMSKAVDPISQVYFMNSPNSQ